MITKLILGAVAVLAAATMLPAPAHAGTDTPECSNAELAASYHRTDAGMSHRYGRIVLHNVSDHACAIRGFGGLSYVGNGDGTQIGAAATRTGSASSRVVDPGERVHSDVDAVISQVYPRRKCRPAHVDGFRVYLPDETRSQYVAHPTTGCRNRHVHLLSHGAYTA